MMKMSTLCKLTVAAFLLGSLFSCGGGSSKKRGGTKGSPAAEPEPEETSEEEGENPDDVGVDGGTADTDSGTTIESEETSKLVHMVMESSATKADYKHTTEFLLMVRSLEESCVTLKVRPGSGITDTVDVENLEDVKNTDGPCTDRATNQPAPEPEPEKEETPDAQLALTLSELRKNNKPSFALTGSETATICDQRNFRMEAVSEGETAENIDLGANEVPRDVVTTYGTLAAVSSGKRIKVWVDSNYAEATQLCSGGSLNTQTPSTPTTYRSSQQVSALVGYGDSLLSAQLQKLANESERIVNDMTSKFGDMGDLDANGAVNVFISPYINRLYFQRVYSTAIDYFHSMPVYRPGDLAPLNIVSNPSSNEGEIIYLWSPNPSGTASYQIYPTSNSLTTSYAYGYVAYQAMQLILSKAKLIDQSLAEDRFLREALSYLGSMYYGGGAYSWRDISHFLNAYTARISLTGKMDMSKFKGSERFEAISGQLGMRALFGWYLHTRICGTTALAPCDGVKTLLTSSETGKKLLETTFSQTWAEILDHFSASVVLGLVDNPSAAYGIANASLENLPDLIQFKHFQELNVTGTKLSGHEHNSDIDSFNASDTTEPAYFSPYPTLEHHPFQVVTPNTDFHMTLAPDGVGFVVLTGIVSQFTDITSYIGKGMRITAIPIGDRDPAKRSVYVESLSKDLSLDTRPVKLFADSAAPVETKRANFIWEPLQTVVTEENFVITQESEGWIVGEINDVTINVEGNMDAKAPDSDHYLIKIDPCGTGDDDGGGTASIAGCDVNTEHHVLVQLYVTPGVTPLSPMMAVTPQSRRAYHGAMASLNTYEVDPTFDPPETDPPEKYLICRAGADSDTGSITGTPNCEFSGLPLANSPCFGKTAGDGSPRMECFNDEFSGQTIVSDALATTADATDDGVSDYGYDFLFDNFSSMGGGYPYDTTKTIRLPLQKTPPGVRPFTAEEKNRMFYNFVFETELLPTSYNFTSFRFGFSDRSVNTFLEQAFDPKALAYLDFEQLLVLSNIRTRITATAPGTVLAADSNDPFLADCASFGVEEAFCQRPCDNAANIVAGIGNFLVEGGLSTICYDNDPANCYKEMFEDYAAEGACTGIDLTLGNIFGQAYGAEAERNFVWMPSTNVSRLTSYYHPVYANTHNFDRCSGFGGANETPFQKCTVKEDTDMGEKDIRNQFWLDATRAKVASTCRNLTFPNAFGFCSDAYSYRSEAEKDLTRAPRYSCSDSEGGLSDPARYSKGPINFRAGELIGLDKRIYPLQFKVAGDRATVVPLLIGGMERSQGKYTVRIRLLNENSCVQNP